jgi:hypothetical protein
MWIRKPSALLISCLFVCSISCTPAADDEADMDRDGMMDDEHMMDEEEREDMMEENHEKDSLENRDMMTGIILLR